MLLSSRRAAVHWLATLGSSWAIYTMAVKQICYAPYELRLTDLYHWLSHNETQIQSAISMRLPSRIISNPFKTCCSGKGQDKCTSVDSPGKCTTRLAVLNRPWERTLPRFVPSTESGTLILLRWFKSRLHIFITKHRGNVCVCMLVMMLPVIESNCVISSPINEFIALMPSMKGKLTTYD